MTLPKLVMLFLSVAATLLMMPPGPLVDRSSVQSLNLDGTALYAASVSLRAPATSGTVTGNTDADADADAFTVAGTGGDTDADARTASVANAKPDTSSHTSSDPSSDPSSDTSSSADAPSPSRMLTADSEFTQYTISTSVDGARSIAAWDFDDDGDLDIVVANYYGACVKA